ncbi:hypothetical protein ACTXT7_005360 [Hymenolepis weldensis]
MLAQSSKREDLPLGQRNGIPKSLGEKSPFLPFSCTDFTELNVPGSKLTSTASVNGMANFPAKAWAADQKQSLFLSASTAAERRDWIRAVRKQLYLKMGGVLINNEQSRSYRIEMTNLHSNANTHIAFTYLLLRGSAQMTEFVYAGGINIVNGAPIHYHLSPVNRLLVVWPLCRQPNTRAKGEKREVIELPWIDACSRWVEDLTKGVDLRNVGKTDKKSKIFSFYQGLFGTHLSEVFAYTSAETKYVPRVVYQTAEFIRKYGGLTTDGIFR